jgi:transposase
MLKITELLRLKYELKLPHRAIAASLAISPSTVSEYIKRVESSQLTWPLPEGMTQEQLHALLFNEDEKEVQAQPDWTQIHQELRRKGVTLHLLWQEYQASHSIGFSYSQFCRLYHQAQKQIDPVMRFTHRAGENCFVDYAGLTVPWVDTRTGEQHESQVFVGCLGASNYTYIEATASQTLREWLTSHANMFDYFGGVPKQCIPDNLKAAVTKAHRYDPDINLTYQHFAEHYGVAILPARSYKPRDKAKVENSVLGVERQILAPLRDRTFTSLADINQALAAGLTAYNAKPFQKLPGSRHSFFLEVDKPALAPLPVNRYEWSDWRSAKVHMDYHVVYDKHCYSVPYRLIGQQLQVRATITHIDCYHELTRIATHTRHYRPGFTTHADHMPPAHQQMTQGSVDYFREKAQLIGPKTQQYVETLMERRAFPQQAFRACLGLLRLGQRYSYPRLEQACQRGLELGAYRYRDIETLLRNGREEAPIIVSPELCLPVHDNVRGADYYQ